MARMGFASKRPACGAGYGLFRVGGMLWTGNTCTRNLAGEPVPIPIRWAHWTRSERGPVRLLLVASYVDAACTHSSFRLTDCHDPDQQLLSSRSHKALSRLATNFLFVGWECTGLPPMSQIFWTSTSSNGDLSVFSTFCLSQETTRYDSVVMNHKSGATEWEESGPNIL
jgi:hypothetical protein